MHNPYIAILAAAVAAWVFGAIWYTALGKRWMMAQGISEAECERRRAQRQMPLKPLIATFATRVRELGHLQPVERLARIA